MQMTVLMTEKEDEISMLRKLEDYLEKKKLELDANKTKIVSFQKEDEK